VQLLQATCAECPADKRTTSQTKCNNINRHAVCKCNMPAASEALLLFFRVQRATSVFGRSKFELCQRRSASELVSSALRSTPAAHPVLVVTVGSSSSATIRSRSAKAEPRARATAKIVRGE